MNTYTQPALFADTEVTGPGRPRPWPMHADQTPDDVTPAVQVDELPFDEEQS